MTADPGTRVERGRRAHGRRLLLVAGTAALLLAASAVAGAASHAAPSKPAPGVRRAPVIKFGPAIVGSARVYSVLKLSSTGSWVTPTKLIRVVPHWQRCNAAGGGCKTIGGVQTTAYRVVKADVGHRLRAVVTAWNSAGRGVAYSRATAVVVRGTPAIKFMPKIAGPAQVYGILKLASTGSWVTPTRLTAIVAHWQRCNAAGSSCKTIGGVRTRAYRLLPVDVGHRLRAAVTAWNSSGRSVAYSRPSAVIIRGAPVIKYQPTIAGPVQVYGILRIANTGSWLTPGRLTAVVAHWQRCDAAGSNCKTLGSVRTRAYRLLPADVGHTLRAVVTAWNSSGRGVAYSRPSAVVARGVPAIKFAPTVAGPLKVNGDLRIASTGSWVTPSKLTAVVAHWQRCDAAGHNCQTIGSVRTRTYRVVPADAGHRLRVVVTAWNSSGRGIAYSRLTPVIGG